MPISPIDISNDQLQIVLDILQKHLDERTRVWVFGSRAKGLAKKFSDLDLAIDAGKALSFDQLIDLENAFVESDFAYKVDVVDIQNVKDSIFKKIIEEQAVELDWKLTAR
ncbi:MAG: nucleotidyltransferase domain-containing protein [Proteobacteria bacterium]|nr:nucleotidyltransferase domain-containing protein [Pseudomonadota bacterium]